ncbi:MAG: GNAT family N-acetyltransferase [Verrucomicrobiota bacterium]
MEKERLWFEAVGERPADLMRFLIPRMDDGAEFLRMGHTTRGFYMNAMLSYGKPPIVRLYRDEKGFVKGAFCISTDNYVARLKASFGVVTEREMRLILDEITRIAEAEGFVDALKIYSFRGLERFCSFLGDQGFQEGEEEDVLMNMSLEGELLEVEAPLGFAVRAHDPSNENEADARGKAQSSGFCGQKVDTLNEEGKRASDLMAEWCMRTSSRDALSINGEGKVGSVAGVDLDPFSGIGEFEPVATAHEFKRQGHAKAVLAEGLREMKRAGMTQAYVRTLVSNVAAIKAYESVGFQVVDKAYLFSR